MLAVLIAGVQLFQRQVPVAVGNAGYAVGGVLIQQSSLYKRLLHLLVVYLLEVDALGTASDGFEQQLRILAHQEEERLAWRLFQELQNLVGTGQVHSLRKPYQANLIAALARHHAQFLREIVGFFGSDDGLLVEVGIHLSHVLHPVAYHDIGTLSQEHLSPLPDVVEAHRRLVAAHIRGLDGREGEVQVGMLPFAEHGAGTSLLVIAHGRQCLGCSIGFVSFAQQVAGKSQCHR